MAEILKLFLAFWCGGFFGMILAALFIAGKRVDEPEEFDGGFSASNHPPVRTTIWGGRVEEPGQ